MNRATWRERLRARADDARVTGVIAVFFAFFFLYFPLTDRQVIVGDALSYSHPLRTVAWEMIRQGSLPLWTPLILSGYPLLSMAQLGLAYPLTWGYLFLPGYLAEQIYLLTPYLLAPAFTYCYAREIGRSRMAALLAGLSFGYGGMMMSLIGSNGMIPHAVMWLPLVLIAIERARTRSFVSCLLLATGAYTMSVLTGIGQGFVYAGMLAAAYACFVVVALPESAAWLSWRRWQPLLVIIGAIILSAGVAAFQILETLRAARRSVRGVLRYETFSEGSFTFTLALKSLIEPIQFQGDVTAYVSLVVIGLGVVGVAARRHSTDGRRIIFWLVVALLAWALMLGSNTPLHRLTWHIPALNRFRVPSRHAFEWTFAISILAACGWDAVSAFLSRAERFSRRRAVCASLLLIMAALTGVLWWQASLKAMTPLASPGGLHRAYLGWKLLFTALIVIGLWQAWRLSHSSWRTGLLAAAVALSCFVEPFIWYYRTLLPYAVPASRFSYLSPATRFLQTFPPSAHRVYSHNHLYAEMGLLQPQLDPLNLSALSGVQNVAGYEPLIMERYSVALGDGNWDRVNTTPGLTPDEKLLGNDSRVLDLLNTSFVAAYSTFSTLLEPLTEKAGVKFAPRDSPLEIKSAAVKTLSALKAEGDSLALVTTLSNSGSVTDGMVVARMRVYGAEGRVIERELRAGSDTSEWAYDRPDVRGVIRHSRAPIFASSPADGFSAHSYWTKIPLGERLRVERVEFTGTLPEVSVGLWRASLHDTVSGNSVPLAALSSDRWELIWQQRDAVILRNRRALPRAWLVGEAEAVDGVEALRRIRGESSRPFDPRRTALLETTSDKLPPLPGGMISPAATARVTAYAPGRLRIETQADTSSVLVISELSYPGWEVSVDGARAKSFTANFLLQAVALPAGAHQVELRYAAHAARNGAVISALTLLLISGLVIYRRRERVRLLTQGFVARGSQTS
jgi:hypothetical protein